MILTTRQFAGLASLASVVVVQSLGTHQTCSPSPLVVSGLPVCVSTSKAASIYGHRSLSPSSSWDGPLDCQGDYCVYSNRVVSKHSWVIDRNGFEIHTGRDGDAVRYVGAFPEQALINHDCRPKSVLHLPLKIDHNSHLAGLSLAYHFRGMTHITTAIRDIDAGEELSLSYIDVTLPLRQRQTRLNALWNSSCTCKACQLPSAGAEASDAPLERIKVLEDILDHPAQSFPVGDLMAQTGSFTSWSDWTCILGMPTGGLR